MKEFWKIVSEVGAAIWDFNIDDGELLKACDAMRECEGRVIVTGVGKAGLIGRKTCATLSSTGCPSLFLCPTDALHGDLGIVNEHDVVLVLSNSGSSAEVIRLIPHLKKIGTKIILVTGNRESETAKLSDIVLGYVCHGEAGHLGLAPTTSAAIMLVIGDALALTIMKQKNFSAEDYARYHPGGALGGKAILVKDVMRKGWIHLQMLNPQGMVSGAMTTLSANRIGLMAVGKPNEGVLGVVSIADCARGLISDRFRKTGECMTLIQHATTAKPDTTIAEAMATMRNHHINQIPVIDNDVVVGLLDIQDIVGLRLDL